MEEIQGFPGTEPQQVASGPPPIMTAADLIYALSRASDSDTIYLPSREYMVGVPLLVPDGVTLQGAGVMDYDAQGLPVGFKPGTTTKITAKSNLAGNLVTLGDKSSVKGLHLQGASQIQVDGEGRGGNVVAVASRRPSQSVSATIERCELNNKITSGAATDGPTGGAILAYTRNPQRGDPPAPHEGASVTVTVTQSIVDTPNAGKAVFAMNFASRGTVNVNLTKNKIGGPLDIIGGMSRPDAVANATTKINSVGNRYSPQGVSAAEGWQIIGGSSSPVGGNAKTESNSASVQSTDDQIENFKVGIRAFGGRRLRDSGTCSNNKVELELIHMKLATKPDGTAADFEFRGAFAESPPGVVSPAGDKNIVRVLVQRTTGSRQRRNVYTNGAESENRLVFRGTLGEFTTSNTNIDPAPTAQFFEHVG
jgi:hypothetical protein